MAKKKTKPTIDEEIEALGGQLYPNAKGAKLTTRKRKGVAPSDVDQEFLYEHVLRVRTAGNQLECKSDSLPQLKASLKRLLKAKANL
jgi:hypothetical protein